MEDTIEITLNDTFREIDNILTRLKEWESDLANPRVKALVITKLEEAQLWSLKLIKDRNF